MALCTEPERRTISTGSREVLDRLFNAFWREGLAASRRLVRPCLCAEEAAVVALPDGSEWLAHVEHHRALDRLRTRPPYVFRPAGDSLRETATPEEALDLLAASCRDPGLDFELLKLECRQSAENLDRFLAAVPQRAEPIARGQRMLDLDEVELESWNLRGHELHPGCKTRFGFSPEDLDRYSCELGRQVDLRFAAVRRSHAVVTGQAELAWREPLNQELRARGLDPEEFVLLAIHPWQWRHQVQPRFEAELRAGHVVELQARFPARPLASLRTLAPVGHPGAHHVKLPLAVQSTSAVRTVSPQSTQNGPRLSALLEGILEGPARLLSEDLGVHFRDADLDRAKHLSMLLRRAPQPIEGTRLVPVAVLAEPSPLNGHPIVREAVERMGGDPAAFLAAYSALTARAFLPALLRYGVAIEAHAQNCLVRLRAGEPVELLLRDLGGIRILFAWLREQRRDVRLHPASVVVAHTEGELVAKTHHTYLQGNLAPIVSALAESYGLSERPLWALAARCIRRVAEELELPARRVDAFFAPRIQVKALTRMRLGGRSHQYDFCTVGNPLA
ncbi:MAG: IucA/IucC family protein [Candidatus Eremiobacterota bacterium]